MEEQIEYKYAFEVKINEKKSLYLRQNEFNNSICKDFLVMSEEDDYGSVNLAFKYKEHAESIIKSLESFYTDLSNSKLNFNLIINKYNLINGEINHKLTLEIRTTEGPFDIESNKNLKYRLELKCSKIESVKFYN